MSRVFFISNKEIVNNMYLLTEWEDHAGKYLARGDVVQMTESQIFSRTARPNSVNKHFIISNLIKK